MAVCYHKTRTLYMASKPAKDEHSAVPAGSRPTSLETQVSGSGEVTPGKFFFKKSLDLHWTKR